MPTIIDSLIVTLGLDSSDFRKKKDEVKDGLKDAGGEADKAGKKLADTGKKGADSFDKTAKSAAKFLALIGGTMALKNFALGQIEANASLDRFAQNIGVNVDTISSWSNAAEIAGGSASGLQGTMDNLSRSQTELQLTGQSGLIPYFSALGMSMTDAHGKAKPVNQLLLDLSGKFSKMDRTTANNMGRMMGIDQGTMQLLLKGRGEVETMIKRQKEYGAVTKQQAEESSRLRAVMVSSTQSFNAFGRELLSAAIPYIEKFFDVMKDFGAWGRQNKEFINDLLIVIGVGMAGIGAATIPINMTAFAVGALALAVAALWQDYQAFQRGEETLAPWAKWEPGLKKAGEAVKWMKNLLGDLIYRAIAAADVMGSVFSGDWDAAKFAAGEFMSGNGMQYSGDEKSGGSGDIKKMISGSPAATANLPNPMGLVFPQIGSPSTQSSSVETRIGEINVYTQATDAKGIAADMGQSMGYLFMSQSNSGLN